MDGWEWIGAVLGVIAVGLTIKQKWWCWPVGIINVVIYIFVFFKVRLYADMGLQVGYVILQIYGWIMWVRGGASHHGVTISRASRTLAALLVAMVVVFAAALGTFLRFKTDAALPYWDSSITALSLAAQYLQAIKKIECWLLWVVVNLLSIGVFAVKGLYPTTGLYVLFLIMSFIGWKEWRT